MATECNIDENQRLKNHGLIFYDGECGFCQFWIQFLLKRDHKNYFLFTPLQGKLALKYIEKSRIFDLDTVILYENNVLYEESNAVLRIAKKLSWPWNFFYILVIIPNFIRNFVYKLIAKNRHRIAKNSSCMLLNENERNKFLD